MKREGGKNRRVNFHNGYIEIFIQKQDIFISKDKNNINRNKSNNNNMYIIDEQIQ